MPTSTLVVGVPDGKARAPSRPVTRPRAGGGSLFLGKGLTGGGGVSG